MKPRSPKKILIVKPSSLGDVVHSLPFLNAVKSGFPKAEIHWVIARGLEGLLEGHPMIDRLIVINKDDWKRAAKAGKTAAEIGRLFKSLREECYDLVVDLQGLFRSGIITMATGAPMRMGFEEAREGSRFFYNRRITGGKETHAVDRYLKVAGALGCDTGEAVFPFPLVKSEAEEVSRLQESLKEYAVVVPGARWETKVWPAGNFGKVASMLPWKTVVIGSRADEQKAEEVVRASGGKAFSLAGKTSLRELIAIMRQAKLVISNDSGPMHIAAGFNVPVVAIFGPTSPRRTGPYGEGHIIVTSDVDCAPCFRKRCGDLKCMEGITVAKVLEKIDNRILNS